MENLKEDENNIDYHISIIKKSLFKIKSLCKNKQDAYLYKTVIINLVENILFYFYF